MNFTLNGMDNILYEAMVEYKNKIRYSSLRYREIDG
jgi:hypothetical protein